MTTDLEHPDITNARLTGYPCGVKDERIARVGHGRVFVHHFSGEKHTKVVRNLVCGIYRNTRYAGRIGILNQIARAIALHRRFRQADVNVARGKDVGHLLVIGEVSH